MDPEKLISLPAYAERYGLSLSTARPSRGPSWNPHRRAVGHWGARVGPRLRPRRPPNPGKYSQP
jgi:hypothetical protein